MAKPIEKKVFPELNNKIKILGINPIVFLILIIIFFPLNGVLIFIVKSLFSYVFACFIDIVFVILILDSYFSQKKGKQSKLNQLINPIEKPIITDNDNILNAFLDEDKRL